jgi:hypothetical protein
MVGLKERKIYVNSLLKVLEYPGITFDGISGIAPVRFA